MIRKRQLLLNTVMSVVQVLTTGVAFLILYGFLHRQLGEEDFGVWAVVLATTSASSIANLGIATSTIKFVSKHLALDDPDRVARIIETSALTVALVVGVFLALCYPLLKELLGFVIEPADRVSHALEILPYAVLSFWATSVSLVFQSCLDGFQRIDIRAVILSAGVLLYLSMGFVLVPSHGLIGIARAQLIQAGFLLVTPWIALKVVNSNLRPIPMRWSRPVFREILGYSLNFQVVSVTRMLLEPTTSALVSKFGGVGAAGYYEMARRLAMQLRAVFVTAHQSIVPTIAELHEIDPGRIRTLYQDSLRLILYLISAVLPLLIALIPWISSVWIGRVEPSFVAFGVLLLAGWFWNMLANPAYFDNMGTGHLRWNVVGHLVIAILNVVLGVVLGTMMGGLGPVIGFAIALVAGSGIILFAYHLRHDISLLSFFDRPLLVLMSASVAGMITVYLAYSFTPWNPLVQIGPLLAIYATFIAIPAWHHPMRHLLMNWVRTGLSGSSESAT